MSLKIKPEPMWVHKNLIIRGLEQHPDMLKTAFPKGPYKTAEAAIKALKRHPGEWFVDGVLTMRKA